MRRFVMLAMLVSAAAPTALSAQGRMPGAGVMQREAGPVDALLKYRTELGLTTDQTARLTAIGQRLEAQNRPLLEQLRAAGFGEMPERNRRVRDLTPAQRDQLRERMQAARPTFQQLRENNKGAREQVRAVLTPQQQDRIRSLMKERRDEMRSKRGEQRRPRAKAGRRPSRNP